MEEMPKITDVIFSAEYAPWSVFHKVRGVGDVMNGLFSNYFRVCVSVEPCKLSPGGGSG